VATFLSAEWLQELDAEARTSRALADVGAVGPVVIEQRIHGSPNGDVVYHFVIDGAGARVVNAAATNPDVTFTTDFDTAVALHTGMVNAQEALTSGALELGGDLHEILQRADALEHLDDVFRRVRAGTTFPEG
jgi:hypothetical protein